MKIETGIFEEEQLDSFQNATLHGVTERIACSIAIIPKYPESLTTEAEIAEYLKSELESLSKKGWDIQVQMGLSSGFEGEKEDVKVAFPLSADEIAIGESEG